MTIPIANVFSAPLTVRQRFGPNTAGAASRFVFGIELSTTAEVDLSTPLPGFLTFRETGTDGGQPIGVLTLRMTPQTHTALRDQNFRDRLVATEVIWIDIRRDWITTALEPFVVGTDDVASDAELAAAGIGTPAADVAEFWSDERYLYLPSHAVLGRIPAGRDLVLLCRSGGATPWFQDPAILFGAQPWLGIADPDLFLAPDGTVGVEAFDPTAGDDLATAIGAIAAPPADEYEILVVPAGVHGIDGLTAPPPRVLLYGDPTGAARPTLTVNVELQLADPQELAFAGFDFDLSAGRLTLSGFGPDPDTPVAWSVRFTQCAFARAAPDATMERLLTASVDRLLLLANEFENGNSTGSGGALRIEQSFGSVFIGNEFTDNRAITGGAFHVQDCSQLLFAANRFTGSRIDPPGASTDGRVDNRFATPPQLARDKFDALVLSRADPPIHARFLYNDTDEIEVEPGSVGVEVVSGRQVVTYLRFVLERASNVNLGGFEQIPYTPRRVLLYHKERAYATTLEVTATTLNIRSTPDTTVGNDNLLGGLPTDTFMIRDPARSPQDDGSWTFQPILLDPRWLPRFAENLYRWDEAPLELWAAEEPVGGGGSLLRHVENEHVSLPTFVRELPVEGGRHVMAVEPGEYIIAVPEVGRWQEVAVEPGDAGTEFTVRVEYGLESGVPNLNTLPQPKRRLIDTALALPATDRLVSEVLAQVTGISALEGRSVPGTTPPRRDLTTAHLVTGVLRGAGLAPGWTAGVADDEPDYYLPDPGADIAGHITVVNDLTQLEPGDVILTGMYHAVDAGGGLSDITMGRVTGGWLYVGPFAGTDVAGRAYAESTTDPSDLLAARMYDAGDRRTVLVEALQRTSVADLVAPVWNESELSTVNDAGIAALPTGVNTSGDPLGVDAESGERIAGHWLRHIRFNAVGGLATAGLPTALSLAVDPANPNAMNLVVEGGTSGDAVGVRIETNPGRSAADPQGDFDLYAEPVTVHETGDPTTGVATDPEFDTGFDVAGELRLTFDVRVDAPMRVRVTVDGQHFYTDEARLATGLQAMLDNPEFSTTTLARADAAWNGLRLPLAPAPAGLAALDRMSDSPTAHANFLGVTPARNVIVNLGSAYRRIGAGPQGTFNGLAEPGVTDLGAFLGGYDFGTGPGISASIVEILQIATEPEGDIEANNTYDDSFMSIGPGQWTLGTGAGRGELPGLLEVFESLSPTGYRELISDLDINYTNTITQNLIQKKFLTVDGTTLNTAALKDQHIRENLRNINVIHHATDDPRFRLSMVYFLIARVRNIFALVRSQHTGYSTVPDGYKSLRMLGYLLSFHIFRPAWIEATIGHQPGNVQDDDGVTEFHARLRQINSLSPYTTAPLNAANRTRADDRLNNHLVPGGLNALPVAPIEDDMVTILDQALEAIRVELGAEGGIMEPVGVEFPTVSPPANAGRYGGFELRTGDRDDAQTYGGAARTGGPFTYVEKLQEDLLRLGYWIGDSTDLPSTDGIFGGGTETGLVIFQREVGLGTPGTESGRVDADTLARLVQALNDPDWHRPGVPSDTRGRSFQLEPSWDPDDPDTPYYLRYPAIQEAGPGIAAHDTFENNDCWATLDTLRRLRAIVTEWASRGNNVAGDRITIGDMSMIGFQQMPGRGATSHRAGVQIDIRSEHSMGNLTIGNDPTDPARNGHDWNRTADFVLLAMDNGFNRIFTNCVHAYRQAAAASPGQRMCAPEPAHHHHVHIERGANLNAYPRDAAGNIDESAEPEADQFCRVPGGGFCAVSGTCPHFTTYP
jgi:hypothetical protein